MVGHSRTQFLFDCVIFLSISLFSSHHALKIKPSYFSIRSNRRSYRHFRARSLHHRWHLNILLIVGFLLILLSCLLLIILIIRLLNGRLWGGLAWGLRLWASNARVAEVQAGNEGGHRKEQNENCYNNLPGFRTGVMISCCTVFGFF